MKWLSPWRFRRCRTVASTTPTYAPSSVRGLLNTSWNRPHPGQQTVPFVGRRGGGCKRKAVLSCRGGGGGPRVLGVCRPAAVTPTVGGGAVPRLSGTTTAVSCVGAP